VNLARFSLAIAILSSSVLAAGAAPSAAPSASPGLGPIGFSPPSWDYGMISQGEVARRTIVATNEGGAALELRLIPTCSCLTVTPSSARLAPGARASFDLAFDSKDDVGITKRGYVIESEPAGAKPVYYLLSGTVRGRKGLPGPGGAPAAAWGSQSGSAGGRLELRYYYTPGCRSCEEFLSSELPRLEASYGVLATLSRRDLLDPSVYEELSAAAASRHVELKAVPVLELGGILLQGDAEIRDKLPGIFQARAWERGAEARSLEPPSAAPGVAAAISVLPVMLAGLVDGINPCAFTTLIFLLASLALAGRGRKEVLVIGSLFTLGVFLTYFAVGLGLFAALRAADSIAIVAKLLRWALAATLLALAALSLVDYAKIRAGKASEMILQLPNALKLRIHASIRTRAKSAALAGSSLVLGFLVSIFEFACTGQVYLPTLAYLARGEAKAGALAYLALYNLCFIAPLVAVFAASYLGVSSKRITQVFQRRMGATKLGLAAVFALLALLTLLT
jgi:cytochrome c biogenesis protein CcdA